MPDETSVQQAMLLVVLTAAVLAIWRGSVPARHDTLPPAAAEIASLLLRAVEADTPDAPHP